MVVVVGVVAVVVVVVAVVVLIVAVVVVLCVCVCPTLDKGSHPTTFTQAGGQWSFQQSLPNKDTADRM